MPDPANERREYDGAGPGKRVVRKWKHTSAKSEGVTTDVA